MVVFAEINKTGEEHAMFNASMLKIFGHLFGSETVKVFMSERHHACIAPIAPFYDNIKFSFVKVIVPLQGNLLVWTFKFCIELIMLVYVLTYAACRGAKLVYFTSLSPPANYLASFLSKYVFSRLTIIITLHGELELIKQQADKKVDVFFGYLLRTAIKLKNSPRSYLVLGNSIKRNFLKYQLITDESLVVIDHPYVFKDRNLISKPNGKPIVFAHLGVTKLSKNSHLFFEVAQSFKKEIDLGLVEFRIIGQVLPEMNAYVNQFVSYSSINQFLTREEYEQQCAEVDYALFFYRNQSYELCSSGAIFDAITYNKPILSLDNNYFEDVFGLTADKPGCLFNNLEDLIDGIKAAMSDDGTSYASYVRGIYQLKDQLRIENIEANFSRQIASILNKV